MMRSEPTRPKSTNQTYLATAIAAKSQSTKSQIFQEFPQLEVKTTNQSNLLFQKPL